ncbi:hypothetical protein [Paenibacillus tengchongensis]|uniref:hypothetical protein n=1 Tax=Paenibacillus tengchongensis TaxID=2608684 RepID=UPI00124F49BE|nr:hypothetical protein [Paenibacillus tengchongensis]
MRRIMKNAMIKSVLVSSIVLAVLPLQQGIAAQGTASAAGTAISAVATTAPKPTAAPIMRDNLSKYGLKKDVELPVTVTAGGLSYTLEKIMIFDFASKEAVALRKTYNYGEESGLVAHPKYFVWTKFTVKNNSKKVLETDTGEKWRLHFQGLKSLDPVYRFQPVKLNDKSAVSWMKLKPAEQLSSYQAYMYAGNFNYFQISLDFNGEYSEISVVEGE